MSSKRQRTISSRSSVLFAANATNGTGAAAAGTYTSGFNAQKYPRLQLRTIEQLLSGVQVERPSTNVAVDETFRKARKAKAAKDAQEELGL